MTVPANIVPLLMSEEAGAGGYQVSRSLRFNSSDSAYCSRVFSSAGNRTSWTLAFWIKRSKLGTGQEIFRANPSSGNENTIWFDTDNTLKFYNYASNAFAGQLYTTQVFRDCSSFYHIVVVWDTGNGTSTDRMRLYVNGNRITAFATASYPTASAQSAGINTATTHFLSATSLTIDGYVADVHFIDGQALTPSSFGETDANGTWQPKAYTGSYGTNGFKLAFSDNSTAAALGTDSSGNGNTWTVNNLSVTAGAGNDALTDSPSNYGTDDGLGASVRGNYCTANPLDNGGQTLANGNLDITGISSNWRSTRGTIGMSSGKWYWEITIGFSNGANNQSLLGIATGAASISGNYASAGAYGWEYYSSNGNKFNNGSNPSYGASYTSGDVIGVAFDADNGNLTFYKNGSSQGTAYSGLTSGPYFPSFSIYGTSLVSFNGGQRPFAYTAPSGFKALCTQNLPQPTGVVAQPSTAMDVKLYTGNGSTQTISGLGFSPDFVWIKQRSGTQFHRLQDTVRGTSKVLYSNATDPEDTTSNDITAFNSDGFSVGSFVNTSSSTYAAWCWDAGSSTVTNTQGSITSSVRANASAGFSIVTWTGNNTSGATIGHGLSATPGLVHIKRRTGSAESWRTWHTFLGTSPTQELLLNDTGAARAITSSVSGVSSSTLTLTNGNAVNGSGENYVAYVFSPVTGYSAMGSYVGNGSSDGVFVYTGFRPRFLIYKRTDAADTVGWIMIDSARDSYNVATKYIGANTSAAEATTNVVDFLSNGFKLRLPGADGNVSGGTYIYAAFAESPFQTARAR